MTKLELQIIRDKIDRHQLEQQDLRIVARLFAFTLIITAMALPFALME